MNKNIIKGQKVKLKTKEQLINEGWIEESGPMASEIFCNCLVNRTIRCIITKQMTEYLGKKVTIQRIGTNERTFRIKEDPWLWAYPISIIEGVN